MAAAKPQAPDPVGEPPKLATFLLMQFSPRPLRDCLLGDLQEEYYRRAIADKGKGNAWYWRQALRTSLHYISAQLASMQCLRFLVIAASTLLLVSLILMISWLSNMSVPPSDPIWNQVLQGQVHRFLFEAEVLFHGFLTLSRRDLGMYFNIPGLMWSLFCLLALALRNRRSLLTPHQLAAWGYCLMLLPYFFGLVFIDIAQPEARKVGPVIAFMVFPSAYMSLPLAYWILRKIRLSKQGNSGQGEL